METIALVILVPLVVGLLTNELTDWLPLLAEKMVRGTVRKLPKCLQERHEPDWLAELEVHPTGFTKVWFAFGLRFGVGKLIQEHERFLKIEYQEIEKMDEKAIAKWTHATVKALTLDIRRGKGQGFFPWWLVSNRFRVPTTKQKLKRKRP